MKTDVKQVAIRDRANHRGARSDLLFGCVGNIKQRSMDAIAPSRAFPRWGFEPWPFGRCAKCFNMRLLGRSGLTANRRRWPCSRSVAPNCFAICPSSRSALLYSKWGGVRSAGAGSLRLADYAIAATRLAGGASSNLFVCPRGRRGGVIASSRGAACVGNCAASSPNCSVPAIAQRRKQRGPRASKASTSPTEVGPPISTICHR